MLHQQSTRSALISSDQLGEKLCVCVCGHGQEGALAGMVLVFLATPPTHLHPPTPWVLSTLEQEPRYSGPCFKSNKLVQRFTDDIWRYQHAKPGWGGGAPLT